MSQPLALPVGNGFYVSESLPASSQYCLNLFPNYPESDSISEAQLFSTPGITEILETGATEVNRGGTTMAGIAYFVNGQKLYNVIRTIDAFGDPVYTHNDLGAIAGSGRVSMADNGVQLCIVVPGTATAYIYTVSGGLVQITDPDFIPSPFASLVNIVLFVDGYFVFLADNSIFFHSELNDGTSYIATDFGKYSDSKGDIIGGHVHKEQLYLFGATEGKAYRNVGGSGFVFQEITGLTFTKGLSAPFSIIETADSFAMIGAGRNESPKIYIYAGNDFAPISTTAIENILQSYNDEQVYDAFALSHSYRGGEFSMWSLDNNSFEYDAKASRLAGAARWHERSSSELQGKTRCRMNSLITAYGSLLCGDSEGGKIGVLDYDVRAEYGNNIEREFALPTIHKDGQVVFHDSIKIIGEFGQGLNGGEAQVGMTYSDDGKNYVDLRYRGAGKLGQYKSYCEWISLGSTNTLRIYKFRLNAPVKWVIYKVVLMIDA